MSDIPIYYHTAVLGVEIADAPPQTNRTPHTDIRVHPHHNFWGPNVYRELCGWIRRNRLHI